MDEPALSTCPTCTRSVADDGRCSFCAAAARRTNTYYVVTVAFLIVALILVYALRSRTSGSVRRVLTRVVATA